MWTNINKNIETDFNKMILSSLTQDVFAPESYKNRILFKHI